MTSTDTPDSALLVSLNEVDVGTLRYANGLTTFSLLDSYLELGERPTFGQAFEGQGETTWRQQGRLPRWFSNLLPEAEMRSLVAEGLDLTETSEFHLLRELTEDMPGAVRLRRVEQEQALQPNAAATTAPPEDDYPVRFTIAGVQIKLSMVWKGNSLRLPGSGDFGDRIVKFSSAQYASVPANEHYTMEWAKDVGIDVARTELRSSDDLGELPDRFKRLSGEEVLVVDRFDVIDGSEDKVHMEDFCQVLSVWPEAKYSAASHELVGSIVSSLCGHDDYLEYVRRLVFCILVGNEDAHLKNWSILYRDRINPTLSPAYDLVSTVQYKDLGRGLGLNFCGSKSFANFNHACFRKLAAACAEDEGQTMEVLNDTVDRMRDTWPGLQQRLEIPAAFRDALSHHQLSIPLIRGKAIV